MSDLPTLLDLPATARLAIADGELALLTVTHEHADKVIVERHRLGTSIDLADLLRIIGTHGLTEPRVTEVKAPELPAPEPEQPVMSAIVSCPKCDRTFKNQHAVDVHLARGHKEQPKEPLPNTLPCPACGLFFDKKVLGRHMTKHKIKPASEPEPSVEPEPEPSVEPEPEPEPIPQHPATLDAPSEYLCSTCSTSLQFHERCGDCRVLLGLGHEAGIAADMVDGRPLCSICVRYHEVERELGLVAA